MAFADRPEDLRAEYERIGRERERASREADRLYRWELVRVCGELIGWTVLGVFIAAFAFWVTDYEIGMILLNAGFVVNFAGVAFSLWTAYKRAEARGDF